MYKFWKKELVFMSEPLEVMLEYKNEEMRMNVNSDGV